jgi:hypothetical protein
MDSEEIFENHKSKNWGEKLVGAAISLPKHIWDDRKQHLHGKTQCELCQKLPQRVHS